MSLFGLTTLIFSFLALNNALMTCDDGFTPLYKRTIAGWNVICCSEGILPNGNGCIGDKGYAGNCASLLNLATDFFCDCGNECTGKVHTNNIGVVVCEGVCTCPPTSDCNNTFPPVNHGAQQPFVPSSASSSVLPGSLFVLFVVSFFFFNNQ